MHYKHRSSKVLAKAGLPSRLVEKMFCPCYSKSISQIVALREISKGGAIISTHFQASFFRSNKVEAD